MWPAAASRMMVPMPSTSHSGPPMQIDSPKPQNAAPRNPAELRLVQLKDLLEVAHDVAADRERHRGGDEGDAAGVKRRCLFMTVCAPRRNDPIVARRTIGHAQGSTSGWRRAAARGAGAGGINHARQLPSPEPRPVRAAVIPNRRRPPGARRPPVNRPSASLRDDQREIVVLLRSTVPGDCRYDRIEQGRRPGLRLPRRRSPRAVPRRTPHPPRSPPRWRHR